MSNVLFFLLIIAFLFIIWLFLKRSSSASGGSAVMKQYWESIEKNGPGNSHDKKDIKEENKKKT